MAVYYGTITEYYESQETIQEKIDALKAIRDALYDSMLEGALKADIEEYKLNDGQTIIQEVLRDPNQIIGAIDKLDKLINKWVNKGIGRTFKLRDKDSFFLNKR